MNKRLVVFFTIFLFSASLVYAQNAIKINDKNIEENASLKIFRDQLSGGKIDVLLKTQEDTQEAEVSFDNGRTWEKMGKTDNGFSCSYRPLSDEELTLVFLLKDKNGSSRTYNPEIGIMYRKNKPAEEITALLDKMKTYYEQENKQMFLSLFSSKFTDFVKFQQSIQNDFLNYDNIRLYYRIDREVLSEDLSSVICDIYWQRKYSITNTSTNKADSAAIGMMAEKEGTRWLITAFRDNTLFGSSLYGGKPDLEISAADIQCSGNYVTVIVHNLGNTDANNVEVKNYNVTLASSCETVTVPRVPGNSQAIVNFSPIACNYCGLGGVTFTVTVDPNQKISEDNRANNEATKSF